MQNSASEFIPKQSEEIPQTSANSSAVPVIQKEKIVASKTYAAQSDIEDIYTILRKASGEYWRVFGASFEKMLEIPQADGVSPKNDLFVADSFDNSRRESGCCSTDFDAFSKQNEAEMSALWRINEA